ncbi:MAG: hypothetical protein PHR21_09555 [Oscillospiraceae bacterium]|nr:hypothetical protein [Oscillospiraceae bacterium]MDD4368621.1 hypothetical protein [Oscillospiraceae bacterium]
MLKNSRTAAVAVKHKLSGQPGNLPYLRYYSVREAMNGDGQTAGLDSIRQPGSWRAGTGFSPWPGRSSQATP